MRTYILRAPRDLTPLIPKGYKLQVVSCPTGRQADISEVEYAMKRAGFNDVRELSWRFPGNWEVTELLLIIQ